MNREMRRISNRGRISNREGRRVQKLGWNKFEDVTLDSHKRSNLFKSQAFPAFNYIFQKNKYIVFVKFNVERKGKYYTKVMCRRSDSKPIYSWNDLYRIKNELFGSHSEAVQFMPPESELTDEANLYWFWIETGVK